MPETAETQPLLNKTQGSPTTTSVTPQNSLTNFSKQNFDKKQQWHSYKHAEIKHEIILYLELAAGAAFVVGLYLMALIPFDQIQRSQLLAARLKPHPLNMDTIEYFMDIKRKSEEQIDNDDDKIRFRLTKRPCNKKMGPYDVEIVEGSNKGQFPHNDHPYFGAQLTYSTNIKNVEIIPYHDVLQLININCLDKKTHKYCPCGYWYYSKRKNICFSFPIIDHQYNYTNQMKYDMFDKYQIDQDFINRYDDKMTLCDRYSTNSTSYLSVNPTTNTTGNENNTVASTVSADDDEYDSEINFCHKYRNEYHNTVLLYKNEHVFVFLYTFKLESRTWWKTHIQ